MQLVYPFFFYLNTIAISVLCLYLEIISYFSWFIMHMFMPKYRSFSQAARTKTRVVHTGHKKVIANRAM